VSRSILGMSMFRELCSSLYQGEEQLDAELLLRVVLLLLLFVGVMKGKKRIVDEMGEMEEINQSSTERIVSTGRIVLT